MRYRTKDGNDYSLPEVGRTINAVIETDKIIENPLFELIEDTLTPPLVSDTNVDTALINTNPVDTARTPTPDQPTIPVDTSPPPAQPVPQFNEQKEQN